MENLTIDSQYSTDVVCFQNVVAYNYSVCTPQLNLTLNKSTVETEIIEDIQTYFIFDAPGEDAFAHWIYESFMFYPMLKKLNETHSNIKIVTKNTKKYVKLLFNFFKINNQVVNTIDSNKNICYFPPVVSLNNHSLNLDLFNRYIQIFSEDIISQLENIRIPQCNIVYFPRNTVDNYSPNDRTIYKADDIKNSVIESGGMSINTYDINNIMYQFICIYMAKNIIVDFGSSYLVNCIFLKNKKIIVLDKGDMSGHQCDFISIKTLNDIICKNNEVVFVKNYDDPLHIISHCTN